MKTILRVPYSLSNFHELWSINCLKWDRHIYVPSVNVVCCFLPGFAKKTDCEELDQILRHVGRVPSAENGELKLLILGQFSTRRNYSRYRKNRARTFTHLRRRYDHGTSGLRWRRIMILSWQRHRVGLQYRWQYIISCHLFSCLVN